MSDFTPTCIACASENNAQTDCCVMKSGDLIRLRGHAQMDFTPGDAERLAKNLMQAAGLTPGAGGVDAPRNHQAGGDHYLNMGIQPWDAMKAWLSAEQFTGFLLGNVIKYTARFNAKKEGKGGLPDLLKARHYLDQVIALEGRL